VIEVRPINPLNVPILLITLLFIIIKLHILFIYWLLKLYILYNDYQVIYLLYNDYYYIYLKLNYKYEYEITYFRLGDKLINSQQLFAIIGDFSK
jgi:hypothetical protein